MRSAILICIVLTTVYITLSNAVRPNESQKRSVSTINMSKRRVEGAYGTNNKRQKRKIIGGDLLSGSPLGQGSSNSGPKGAQRSQVQGSSGGGLLGGVLGGGGGVGI